MILSYSLHVDCLHNISIKFPKSTEPRYGLRFFLLLLLICQREKKAKSTENGTDETRSRLNAYVKRHKFRMIVIARWPILNTIFFFAGHKNTEKQRELIFSCF